MLQLYLPFTGVQDKTLAGFPQPDNEKEHGSSVVELAFQCQLSLGAYNLNGSVPR